MKTYQLKTKYSNYTAYISKAQYINGRLALSFHDATDGMKILIATVNLPDVDLREGEVIIKDYSENEGLFNWGDKNGLWEFVADCATGYSISKVVKLLKPVHEI